VPTDLFDKDTVEDRDQWRFAMNNRLSKARFPPDFSLGQEIAITTLRPFGPRVTLTASAKISIPRNMRSRASLENLMSFAVIRSSHFK
jgi:hypothetical protein